MKLVTGVGSTRGWISSKRGYRRRYNGGSSLGGFISLVAVMLLSGGFLVAYDNGLRGAGIGILCGGFAIIVLTIWFYVARHKRRKRHGEQVQAEQKPVEAQG